jgi:hypothetical protein
MMPKQVRPNLGDKIPDALSDTISVLDTVVGQLFAEKFVKQGDPFGSSNTARIQNLPEEILRS